MSFYRPPPPPLFKTKVFFGPQFSYLSLEKLLFL
jgi:hypothetical protein